MAWMEMIRLRTTTVLPSAVMDELRRVATGMATGVQRPRVGLYGSTQWEGDLGLVLEWEAGPAHQGGSEFGQELAAMLKPYGLVDHSVWLRDGGPADAFEKDGENS